MPTTIVPLVEQDPDGEVSAMGAQERPGEQRIAVEELHLCGCPSRLVQAGLHRHRGSEAIWAGLNVKSRGAFWGGVGQYPCGKRAAWH